MTTQVACYGGPRDGLELEVEALTAVLLLPLAGDVDLEMINSVHSFEDLPYQSTRYVLSQPVTRPTAVYHWDPDGKTWNELYWRPSQHG